MAAEVLSDGRMEGGGKIAEQKFSRETGGAGGRAVLLMNHSVKGLTVAWWDLPVCWAESLRSILERCFFWEDRNHWK